MTMYRMENPSFSSTLLDEIYRSIDDGENRNHDLKFYTDSVSRKQSKYSQVEKVNKKISVLQHSSLIEKYMDYKANEKDYTQQKRQYMRKFEKTEGDLEHDSMFFSSTSTSSDSSSGGFSSSDTDSMLGSRSFASSLGLPRPKPVRTTVAARKEKTEKTESALFYKQRELRMIDDYHYNSAPDITPRFDETSVKSKSRALKIYGNLKKVKQPISPGGKLANFINSLFTNGNTKKSKNQSSSPATSFTNYEEETKYKPGQASTCSSASSFSRSCLRKPSPSTREKLQNGVKRTVTFYPVSVIVDEDCRPSGQKFLYQQEEESNTMSVSLPTAWKIGKSPSRRAHEEVKNQVKEKSRKVEFARELLKDYHLHVKKNDITMRDVLGNYSRNYMEDEDDDDARSCSSSDLFELDHLSVMRNNRYCEELPVYETTHVDTNRAIAKGLLV